MREHIKGLLLAVSLVIVLTIVQTVMQRTYIKEVSITEPTLSQEVRCVDDEGMIWVFTTEDEEEYEDMMKYKKLKLTMYDNNTTDTIIDDKIIKIKQIR